MGKGDITLVEVSEIPPQMRRGKKSKYAVKLEEFISSGSESSQVIVDSVPSAFAMFKRAIQKNPEYEKNIYVITRKVDGKREVFLIRP